MPINFNIKSKVATNNLLMANPNQVAQTATNIQSSQVNTSKSSKLNILNTKNSNTPIVVHTLEKCFVDLNFNINENTGYFIPINTVFFTQNKILSEGESSEIVISLSAPSMLGLEEVDLRYIGSNDSVSAILQDDLEIDFNTTQSLRLSWKVGEKEKKIPFKVRTDFLKENSEIFYFKLENFTNCIAGDNIDFEVTAIDSTTLPSIGITSVGGSYYLDENNTYKLLFGVDEFTEKNINIDLSYPSINGNESVTIEFVNQTATDKDYKLSGPVTLSWAKGEQTKTITIEAFMDDEIFESSIETVVLNLKNPINAIIEPQPTYIPTTQIGRFPFSTIQIFAQPEIFRYARLKLFPFFTQAGRSNDFVTLKRPYASYKNGYNQEENNLFFPYNPLAPTTFNPQFNSTQTLNNFNNNLLSLEIRNVGEYKTKINNKIVEPGDVIVIDNLSEDYYIDLQANDGPIASPTGKVFYTFINYELTLIMKFKGNDSAVYTNGDFRLKNSDNTDASIAQRFNLGKFQVPGKFLNEYTKVENIYQLVTKFSNIRTGRNGNQCPISNFLDSTVEKAQVNGIFFLDSRSKTQYIGIEFLTNGGIKPTCASVQLTTPYEILN